MISIARALSLTALTLSSGLACDRGAGEPSSSPDQDAREAQHEELERALAELEDHALRVAALSRLRALAYELEQDGDEAARADAAARILPVLEARWAVGDAGERQTALVIASSLAGPEAQGLWRVALAGVDDEHLRLALAGIRRAPAPGVRAALLGRLEEELTRLGPHTTGSRLPPMQALIETAGELRIADATPLLIRALERPKLPTALYRSLITALGHIGDPRAVDALIAAQFRIADVPGVLSVGERAVRALGAIGEPALPGVLLTFAGNNRRVNELLVSNAIPPEVAARTAVRILGVIASSRAVGPLLADFPTAGCRGAPASADPDAQREQILDRAFRANALGFIADEAAVPQLCACTESSSPTDVWEVVTALGRIGGDEAFTCLKSVVERGRYDPDEVAAGSELQLRWEAFRWAVLAAPPARAAELSELLTRAEPEVRAQIEHAEHPAALALLRSCGEDPSCYAAILDDPSQAANKRELAAFVLARAAAAPDLELAASLARAFAVPDPRARLNLAWLTGKVAGGRACPACVEALEQVMEDEDTTQDATMQGARVMAWQTLDKSYAGAHE